MCLLYAMRQRANIDALILAGNQHAIGKGRVVVVMLGYLGQDRRAAKF